MDERVRRLAECFQRVLGEEALALGRELGLRNRKLKVTELVATLVLGWWADPEATRAELAARAAEWFDVDLSPQALSGRLSAQVEELLRRLLDRALAQVVDREPTALPILDRFPAVFLDDATSLALPDELRDRYPGCGNQRAEAARAGLKGLVRLEVRSGALAAIVPGAGRDNDVALARRLPPPPPCSLLLRDRGFFDTAALAALGRAQVFWLTRLPTGLTLAVTPDGTRQELADFLRRQRGDQIDMRAWLGAQGLPCRLLAQRCPPEVAQRRRRQLKQTTRRKTGRQPTRRQLTLCDWFVLVTNLPQTWLTLAEALVLYRVRWQIEIVFKGYKSDGGLDRSRARRGTPRLVELWAKWLARVLEHWVLLRHGGPLSLQSWRSRLRHLRRSVPQLAAAVFGRLDRLAATLTTILRRLGRLPRKPRRRKHPGTRELLENPKRLIATLS